MNLDGFDEALSAQIVTHAAAKKVQPEPTTARNRNSLVLAVTLGSALLLSLGAVPVGVFL